MQGFARIPGDTAGVPFHCRPANRRSGTGCPLSPISLTAGVTRVKLLPPVSFCLFIAALMLLAGTASAAPVAQFSGTPTSGVAPLTVTFTDASTGGPTGWAWFFGDETYTQSWTQQTASAGWSIRYQHTSVAMPDGSIVLMGGAAGSKKNDVWRSTNNGATWTVQTAGAEWSARRFHTSVAMPDGSIVLMGGYTSEYKNDVRRFSPIGSSAQSPSHTYTVAGTYPVALQAYNAVGYSSMRKTDYITVTAPVPTFTGIVPTSGTTAGGTSVTITGTGFTGATAVTFGGTAATPFTVDTDSQITATTPAHAAGAVDVVVTTPGGTVTGTGTYSYVTPPTFTGITPASGPTAGGTSVTITGTNFVDGGAFGVTIGGVAATGISRTDATHIAATTPAGTAGARDVVVTNNDGQTATGTGAYTYVAPPTFTGIVPTSGTTAGGTTVTITGTGFIGATAVTFGGTAATAFTVDTDTQITATTPTHAAGAVDVAVTTPGGTATGTNAYTYVAPPTFTGIAPTSGSTAGGTTVTITGTNFVDGGAFGVTIGGTAATGVVRDSATQITAVTPAGTAGSRDVVVTNNDGQTATGTGAYTYVAPPTFTGIAPTSGPTAGGTTVTITGTNFVSGGAFGVTIGGTAATGVVRDSATQITAVTPAGTAGARDVVVSNNDGQTATGTGAYTYVAPPTFTGITPASGTTAGGTTVTITGTGFTGATAVTFGGTAATAFTIDSDTQITATTPAHAAGAVDVVVTTPGGTATGTSAYTYTSGPTFTNIAPTSGTTAGGTTVTITGTGFTGATAVTFGGTAATAFTIDSDTQITATTPAHAAGAVDVVVTTPGGTATRTGAYTYTAAPAPASQPGGGSDSSSGDGPAPAQAPGTAGTVSVNVGHTAITHADVTGVGVNDIIVTAAEAHGPGIDISPPSGTIYEYVDISPARHTTITEAVISFSVPVSWLEENHIPPQNVVMNHLVGKTWNALPTTLVRIENGIAYYTAKSPSFSRFAIAGQSNNSMTTRDPTPLMTVLITGDLVQASGTQSATTTGTTSYHEHLATQTTVIPALQPAPDFPPVTIVILGVVSVVLIGGGFLIRRWWIRRQNPALFRDYD